MVARRNLVVCASVAGITLLATAPVFAGSFPTERCALAERPATVGLLVACDWISPLPVAADLPVPCKVPMASGATVEVSVGAFEPLNGVNGSYVESQSGFV